MPAVPTTSRAPSRSILQASRRALCRLGCCEGFNRKAEVDGVTDNQLKEEGEKNRETTAVGHSSALTGCFTLGHRWVFGVLSFTIQTLSLTKKLSAKRSKLRRYVMYLASADTSLTRRLDQKPICPGSVTDRDITADYELGKMIGRGRDGVVSICTKRATGKLFACKALGKEALYEEEKVRLRLEVAVMKKLQGHPNIVQLESVYEDANQVYIVMEYCSGGTLTEYILEHGHYSERAAAYILRTLADVIRHCNKNGVVHRDVKLENLLLGSRQEGAEIKMIDFGSSAFYTPDVPLTELEGTAFFMAPELLAGSYGPESDIWSCGVCLYVLLCGHPPFVGDSLLATWHQVNNADPDLSSGTWSAVSPAAKALVSAMLSRDPKKRPTAAQVLEVAWVREPPDVSLAATVVPRLKTFAALSYFHKICLMAVGRRLPPEILSQLRSAFAEVDVDNSGSITVDELEASLDKIGLSQQSREAVKALMRSVDMNQSGAIELDEFVAATLWLKLEYIADGARAVFQQFSGGDVGGITRARLAHACQEYGVVDPCLINMMMDEVDKNKDGWISYKEFLSAMKISRWQSPTEGGFQKQLPRNG